MFVPLLLILLACATAATATSADISITVGEVLSDNDTAGKIDVTCTNRAQLVKTAGKWAGWCHGRRSFWSGDQICDCVSTLYFQKRRLHGKTENTTRVAVGKNIKSACDLIEQRNAIAFYDRCKAAGFTKECLREWVWSRFKTYRCDCNGHPCYGNLQPVKENMRFCDAYKIFKRKKG